MLVCIIRQDGVNYFFSRRDWVTFFYIREIGQQNWTGAENFYNCFCVTFNCYFKSINSGIKTGLCLYRFS